MSFVNKLNFVPLTVSQEPQAEITPQQPVPQPPTNAGIASTADQFESADSYNLMQQQTAPPVNDQLLIPPDPTVEASMLFNYVVDVQEPQPPVQPEPPEQMFSAEGNVAESESAFAKTLEDFAEKKIKDTYESKTSKEFGPDVSRETISETESYGKDVGMPENLSSLGGGGGTTVGELEGSWNLFEFGKIDEKTEGELGSAYAKGSTQILGLSGQVYYNVGVDLDKWTAKAGVGAKGSAEIVGAHYEAGFETADVEIGDSKVDLNGKVNGDAYVGVKGNIEGSITVGKEMNLSLGAGGFDGANASAAGKIGAGELGDVHGNIGAWAGVGAKASFDVGFKDGKFSADWGLGLALGAGAEWDLGVTVDFSEIVDTGLDGMREIGFEEEADWIENTAGDAIEFAGDAASWAGEAAEDGIDAVGEAADDAADAAGDVIDEIGDTAEDIGDEIGDAAGDVVDWFEDWP